MTVIAVYLGTLMATLAISIVTVALPAIQEGLQTSLSGLQWVVGAYALCLSSFMLSAGPLGDRYGRKRAWVAGVVLFVVGSTASAGAQSLAMLIAGCSMQGVGGALVIPGALSILTHVFPDPVERGHAIGAWSSFSAVTLIIGPMLGGLLVDNVGWPSIFLINLPVGMVALALGLVGITEGADPDHAALDPAGQLLSVIFLAALTYSLIGNADAEWSAEVALIVAAFALALFVIVEIRAVRPLLPLDLFREPAFAAANFASFVLGFAGYSSLFLFALFLQQAQGWTATQAGWGVTPVFAAMAMVAAMFGVLARRHDPRRLMVFGYLLLGIAMLAMSSFTPVTSFAVIAPFFALLGVGMGLAVPSTSAVTMNLAPRERTGTASATMNALRQGGMTIGIALLGTVMAARAVSSMAVGLRDAKIADAAAFADAIVRRHSMPTGMTLGPQRVHELLAASLSHGFELAVATAGVSGLLAAAILALLTRRAGTTSTPSQSEG